MIQNRSARFWVASIVLFGGDALFVWFSRPMTVPDMVYSATILFAALALFDLETAKLWSGRIIQFVMFWKKGDDSVHPQ